MKTATQTRAEQAEMEIAFRCMASSHELAQAEKIVRHYLAHLTLCQGIIYAIKTLEPGKEVPQAMKDFILMNVEFLKRNHAKDFGIELKWETSPNPPSHFPQSQPQHQ